jgi:hypothetical protein
MLNRILSSPADLEFCGVPANILKREERNKESTCALVPKLYKGLPYWQAIFDGHVLSTASIAIFGLIC